MQIIIFLILFVMALFGIPTIWFMVELFMESGTREFEPIINAIRPYIQAIIMNDNNFKGNQLFWDYKTKTMYGHPVMVA